MAQGTSSLALKQIVRLVVQAMALCFAGMTAQAARAESLRVFPGEYLITESRRAAALQLSSAAQHRVTRSLGSRVSLIERKDPKVAAFRVRSSVPFDPSDTFCQSIIAAGTAATCSPNFEIRALEQSGPPSDPLLAEQWGFERVGADKVWSELTATPESVVAVVDSGVDYTHPDLKGVLWENPAEVPDNGIDDDANGYVDDQRGLDITTGRGDPVDRLGHGTHVAGIIAALPDNGKGVRGLVPNAKILALRIFDDQGVGSLASAIEAFTYVEQLRLKGVNVRAVNASWGGAGFSEPLKTAIERLGSVGVVVSAAAGNSGVNNDKTPEYPASFALPNLLAVAAISVDGTRASFSNYGLTSVAIAAPGDGIVSTVPRGEYAYYSGTSMAAPFVTSAVALLAAREPTLSASEIVTRIRSAARASKNLSSVIASGGELSLPLLLTGTDGASAVDGKCGGTDCRSRRARVRQLSAQGRNRRGVRTSGRVTPGDDLEVQVRGSGSGAVSLVVALDGHRCPARLPAKMVKGAGKLRIRTPQKLRYFRKISIMSGRRSSSVAVRAKGAVGWVLASQPDQKMVCKSLVVSAR